MPQLDFLTFSLQVGIILWVFWSLYLSIVSLILPQYLLIDNSKKHLWVELKSYLVLVKSYSMNTFFEFICFTNKMLEILSLYLKNLKFLRTFLTYNFLKLILKSYTLEKFLEILNFSNINLIDNTFGQKNKLNFLLIKNSTYSFVQKYYQLSLYLKVKKTKLLLKEQLEYRLDIDEVIKNLSFKNF